MNIDIIELCSKYKLVLFAIQRKKKKIFLSDNSLKNNLVNSSECIIKIDYAGTKLTFSNELVNDLFDSWNNEYLQITHRELRLKYLYTQC